MLQYSGYPYWRTAFLSKPKNLLFLLCENILFYNPLNSMWHKDTSWSKFIHGTKQIILIPEHFKVILYAKCYSTMRERKGSTSLLHPSAKLWDSSKRS